MTVEIAGRIKDDAGDAISGATVNIYARGTTTPSLGSDTTDANGEFDITDSTDRAIDVKITNGTDVLWRSSRDQVQVQTVQVWQEAANEWGLVIVRAEDASSVEVAKFEGNRATPADGDAAYHSFLMSDDGGNQEEVARVTWTQNDVNPSADGGYKISLAVAGSLTDILNLNVSAAGVGSATLSSADLFVSDGQGVVIGHTAQIMVGGLTPETQIIGTSMGNDAGLLIAGFAVGDSPAAISLLRSRNATIGTGNTALQASEFAGAIRVFAADGTDFASEGARIAAHAESNHGMDDVPMYWAFYTTADGGNSPTEKWRIDSVGNLTSAGAVSNVTADGAVLATGGMAFTDVLNAWIDDATHGTGTTTHYIGNETIDTTASDARLKDNITPANGTSREHLQLLAPLLRDYDYKNGMGHFSGLVAQEVMEVLPQYVVGDEQEYSLRYHYMVGPLIGGWKNHEERLAALERKVA